MQIHLCISHIRNAKLIDRVKLLPSAYQNVSTIKYILTECIDLAASKQRYHNINDIKELSEMVKIDDIILYRKMLGFSKNISEKIRNVFINKHKKPINYKRIYEPNSLWSPAECRNAP